MMLGHSGPHAGAFTAEVMSVSLGWWALFKFAWIAPNRHQGNVITLLETNLLAAPLA